MSRATKQLNRAMPSDQLEWLADASQADRQKLSDWLTATEKTEFVYRWEYWARPNQLPPPGDWRTWLIMAGRGFGKTRAGAEWVRMVAERNPKARIALVAASLGEARAVMVEGESGIMACTPPSRRPKFEPSLGRLRFPNGALASLFSAAEAESLRGPEHSHAWCDEIGKWPLSHGRATSAWDNLLLGLRLGEHQQVLATTTPRNVPLLRRLVEASEDCDTVITRGATRDNEAYLPPYFISKMEAEFGGSQLGRQELNGELLTDTEGALWTRQLIEECRDPAGTSDPLRTIIAVDPPASSRGDACGIIIASLGVDGIARVLADRTIEKPTPEQWARRVAECYTEWAADRIIAEANQGGAMVASVLRAASQDLPLKLVHASKGKSARAEPIAALYEAGRVRHKGVFAALEDQMCSITIGGQYTGPGRSPDRADALVWALSELMLTPLPAPRVTTI